MKEKLSNWKVMRLERVYVAGTQYFDDIIVEWGIKKAWDDDDSTYVCIKQIRVNVADLKDKEIEFFCDLWDNNFKRYIFPLAIAAVADNVIYIVGPIREDGTRTVESTEPMGIYRKTCNIWKGSQLEQKYVFTIKPGKESEIGRKVREEAEAEEAEQRRRKEAKEAEAAPRKRRKKEAVAAYSESVGCDNSLGIFAFGFYPVVVGISMGREQAEREECAPMICELPDPKYVYYEGFLMLDKLDQSIFLEKKLEWECRLCLRKEDLTKVLELWYGEDVHKWELQGILDLIEGDLVWIVGFGD